MVTNDERLLDLRRYQAAMLKRTYSDLMEDGPSRRLLEFILNTIYTPDDINFPTETFRKIYEYFTEKPKGKDISILARLLELNRLSEELDLAVLQKLGRGEITDTAYEDALRACNNRRERERHIELFVECITTLHQLTRHPLNAFMFKVIKLLMSYLGRPKAIRIVEEGYDAFLGIEDISRFTGIVRQREMERLERVYGG